MSDNTKRTVTITILIVLIVFSILNYIKPIILINKSLSVNVLLVMKYHRYTKKEDITDKYIITKNNIIKKVTRRENNKIYIDGDSMLSLRGYIQEKDIKYIVDNYVSLNKHTYRVYDVLIILNTIYLTIIKITKETS